MNYQQHEPYFRKFFEKEDLPELVNVPNNFIVHLDFESATIGTDEIFDEIIGNEAIFKLYKHRGLV